MTPNLPPLLQQAITEKIADLQKRELDFGWEIRHPFEEYLLDWRTRIEQYFLRTFVISLRPDRVQHWDLVTAQQTGWPQIQQEALDGLSDLAEDVALVGEEREREAFLLGALYGRWQLALGGLEDPDRAWPAYALAGIGGALFATRLYAWGAVYRDKIARMFQGMQVQQGTLFETLTQFDALVSGLGGRVGALARNQWYYAAVSGEQAALAPFRPQIGEVWLIKDETACAICKALHLTITTKIPVKDSHPDCLVGDTKVGHATARAVTQRSYKGIFITVSVAGGERLTITENHPVLTTVGWKRAGALVEGDQVICCTSPERVVARVEHYDVEMPPLIAEVEEALRRAGSMTTVEVKQTAEDFHGDGTDGQVAYVSSARDLVHRAYASRGEHVLERGFGGRSVMLPARDRRRLPNPLGLPSYPTAGCLMGGSHLTRTLLRRHPLPLQTLRLALRAERRTQASQADLDGLTPHAGALRELKDRFPGKVAARDVLHVERELAERHVYNLEADSGYYTGNSIVVANCRCIKVPVAKNFTPTPVSFSTFADRHAYRP